MSFRDFHQSVISPDLQAIAAHWGAARGKKRMPAFRDIDPVALGRTLRYVWAWRYDRATGDFINRLAGEEIIRAFGRSPRGMKMTEFLPPEAYQEFRPWHLRVVEEPAFLHGAGKVYSRVDRNFTGERIMLPLSEDGVTGDGLLGATVYVATAGVGAAPSYEAEKLDFYPLD
jgi:hypothetical protein